MFFTDYSANTYLSAEILISRSCSKCCPVKLQNYTVKQFQLHILLIVENISDD
jgi:hypothetical protein